MREIILPSGVIAQIRKGKGRDLIIAQRTAREPNEIPMALTAELTTINGNKVIFEDLLEMDLEDVLALQSEVLGKNASAPQKA